MRQTHLTDSIRAEVGGAFASGAFTEGGVVVSTQGKRAITFYPDRAGGEDRVFDAASMTKVLSTWPLTVMALEAHKMSLLQPVGTLLAARGDEALPGADVTIAHLLTHTAALKQEGRLDKYSNLENLEVVILGEPLDGVPGVTVAYGNRSFMLLGRLLELVYDRPLSRLFDELVRPGFHLSTRSGFCLRAAPNLASPTVRVYSGERLVGIPHDKNAELLGGAAGHAGCFTNLADLAAFGEEVIRRYHVGGHRLSVEKLSFAPWYREGDAWRGLAWRIALPPSEGRTIAFHHGFTGGSIFLDLDSEVVVGILTNSVNVRERHPNLALMRSRVLTLLLENET